MLWKSFKHIFSLIKLAYKQFHMLRSVKWINKIKLCFFLVIESNPIVCATHNICTSI